MSDQDSNISNYVTVPITSKDLIIHIDECSGAGIKNVVFKFKDHTIAFTRDEILNILIKLQQGRLR